MLGDYGYTVRVVPEKLLTYNGANGLGVNFDPDSNPNNPIPYYTGGAGPTGGSTSNVLWSAMLVIVSGSGGAADMPPPNTNGVPIIMGDHSCLGDSTTTPPADHSEIFLYSNKSSGNSGLTGGGGVSGAPGLYMRVVNPTHPIMQGIPLDAQGRVKMWRDPYPEENLHNNPGGKVNYEISWTCVDINPTKSVPAPGLNIIGTLDFPNTNQVVFAVMEAGGGLANTGDATSPWSGYTIAPSRLVHYFVNENGSGNIRRSFNALSALGRVIFVRTCKWAMGETLAPFQGLGIIDVGQVSPSNIKLSWSKLSDKNYRIDGTTDFVNWVPIVDSITNPAGSIVSRTLNIASAPQAVYMRVAALP